MTRTQKQTNRLLALLLLFAAAASFSMVAGQEKSASDEVIEINSELVVIDAQVIDKKTRQPVVDFKRDDFELYENGVRQNITHFSRDKLPLSIVLMLDVSGSTRRVVEQVGAGAVNALRHLKPEDEVAVMAFADAVTLVQDFSTDRQLISSKIKEAAGTNYVGYGNANIRDVISPAIEQMRESANPLGRRVIIIITDNVVPPPSDKSGEAFREALASGSTVCGLIVRDSVAKLFNTLRIFKGGINSYVSETGGEMITAERAEIETKFTQLIEHLRTRYSFGYRPANASTVETFRRIDLKIAPAAAHKRKLAIQLKKGYYARARSVKRT
ncbi:MAG: VWA domain-containing protein [Pyrinomonadaceae bacterium]